MRYNAHPSNLHNAKIQILQFDGAQHNLKLPRMFQVIYQHAKLN